MHTEHLRAKGPSLVTGETTQVASRQKISVWLLLLMLMAFAVCARAAATDYPGELEALRAEVVRLRAENAQLRLSPAALAADVETAVKAQDADKAKAALKRLTDKYPLSAEADHAGKRVEALLARQRAAQEEAKRVAALGFKALRTSPFFSHGETSMGLTATGVVTRWIFDRHGDGWKYLDVEKGRKFITATVTVSSKSKDPLLFGIGAYVANGATLIHVGKVRYRFIRWRDYGSFLGTQADFRNDFSHHSRIPFSVGVSVADEELRRRPLYLIATREGCHRRLYERFGQPPIQYVPSNCHSLKPTLTIADFKDGALAVIKRLD
jgi:hypothetical protein